jgi:hypothetical protein
LVPNISISCIETREDYVDRAAYAVERTASCLPVDCVYWFSDAHFPRALPGIDVIRIGSTVDFVNFFDAVNYLCLRVMPRVVTTDFNIVVQWDGFAVNQGAWDQEFLNYDYIGACWLWMWGGRPIVGNGGFSLRSRKLYDALCKINLKWRVADWQSDPRLDQAEYFVLGPDGAKQLPEDLLICLWYREMLVRDFGIRFCPPELASKFSVERESPLTRQWLGRSFGFHSPWAAEKYGVTL